MRENFISYSPLLIQKKKWMVEKMSFKPKKSDVEILTCIAEHRMLTMAQMTLLLDKNKKGLWRRLYTLKKESIVVLEKWEIPKGRGRPELMISLSNHGVDLLRKTDLLSADIINENVTAEKIHCRAHQLMLNWFRVHINIIERDIPRLRVAFLSHSSPFLPRNKEGKPLITDRVTVGDSDDDTVKFTPDAVFSIHDTIYNQRVLFFLEVDCATETAVSPKRNPIDIRQKIINYQSHFRSERYKKYENYWQCKLNGFRLLILTNTESRLISLCRLVQEMPPSNFVWLSEQKRMITEGLRSKIWTRSSKANSSTHSILGTITCPNTP